MTSLILRIGLEAMDRISRPFQSASRATERLEAGLRQAAGRVRGLEQSAADIAAFRRLHSAADANATALAAAKERARQLAQALAAAGGGSAKAQREFAAARAEVTRLQNVEQQTTRQTQQLRERLGQAGINTRQLASASRQLQADLAGARAEAQRQSAALERLRQRQHQVTQARERMSAAFGRRNAIAGAGAGAVAGGSIGLLGIKSLTDDASEAQHTMAGFGLVAGMAEGPLAQLDREIQAVAETVNQTAPAMREGLGMMVGKGFLLDQAKASYGIVGKAATATGADMKDMTGLAFSAIDTLKVAEAELPKALDIMARAGDLGGFELKDMAGAFPQLTASAKALGMEGTNAIGSLAAALQIAQKGAANPEEAANNMANFLQKMASPDAVKNFKKFGINLKTELKRAVAGGEDPIEAMMKLIARATGKDLEKEMQAAVAAGADPKAAAAALGEKFKLGELFGDAQVMNFLTPMLANIQEFRRIREEAMGADGNIDKKFQVMMATNQEATKGLGIAANNLSVTFGSALLPTLTPLIQGLGKLLSKLNIWAQENPKLATGLITVAAAVAALAVGGGALALTIAAIMGPFAMMRFGLSMLGIQSGLTGGGLARLGAIARSTFAMVAGGLRTLALALMANPMVLVFAGIVAAVAGLAWAVYTYWGPLTDLFQGLWASWGGPVIALWDGIAGAFHSGMDTITGIFSRDPLPMIAAAWAPIGDWFGGLLGGITDAFQTALGWIMEKFKAIQDAAAWVSNAFGGLFGGKSVGSESPFSNGAASAGGALTGATSTLPSLSTVPAPAPMRIVPTATPATVIHATSPAPGAARGGASPAQVHNNQRYDITVNAAPGMDEAAVARAVQRELASRDTADRSRARSALYDKVD